MSVEPQDVARLVEGYAATQLDEARKYQNREPLDDSGVGSLHRLAADIYALGYEEGLRTAYTRHQGSRDRERDAR